MEQWQKKEPMVGTFEATSDFSGWLEELKKSSITEIDVIGLCDRKTGEKREFIAFDRVLESIEKQKNEYGTHDGRLVADLIKMQVLSYRG